MEGARQKWSRAARLLAVVLAGLAPVAAAAAENLEQRVRIAYPIASVTLAPAWIAKDLGFFREEGLAVEMSLIGSSTAIVHALLAGDVQAGVSVGAPPIVAAIAHGADLTIAAVQGNRLDYILVSRAPVKTPGDLAGKKLGIGALGASAELVTRLALEKLGVDPKSVVLLAVGGSPARIAALSAGSIDASVLTAAEFRQVRDQVPFHVVLDLASSDLDFPYNTLVVSRRFATEKRLLVLAMIRALAKGVRFMRANPEESVRIAARWVKTTDTEPLRGQWRHVAFHLWQDIPRATEPGFRLVVQGLVGKNPKVAELRMADVFDGSFVDELEKSGFFGKK